MQGMYRWTPCEDRAVFTTGISTQTGYGESMQVRRVKLEEILPERGLLRFPVGLLVSASPQQHSTNKPHEQSRGNVVHQIQIINAEKLY